MIYEISESPTHRPPAVFPAAGALDIVKIMQCTNLGGMEQVAYGLIDQMAAKAGCRFRVTTPRPFGRGHPRLASVDPNAKDFVYRGKFGWRSFPAFRQHVYQLAEGASAAWVTGTCAASLAAIKHLPLRKVLSHHYHHFERPTSRAQWFGFYNLLCRKLDIVTYPTNFTRNEAISIAPWLKEKSHVVRYGYTVHYHSEEERLRLQRDARTRLGLPEDAFIIGNAGWLIPRKRFDVFLQTAARLAKDLPRAYFVICGGGPLESELRASAASLGLFDRIRFTGWVEDLAPYYRSWDVCLFNSDFDTLPCASMEPAAHGCVMVGSLIYGGLGEFYESGVNGVLLTRHDADELARAIVDLTRSPARAQEFREAAAARMKAEYSMEQSVQFYRWALSGTSAEMPMAKAAVVQ